MPRTRRKAAPEPTPPAPFGGTLFLGPDEEDLAAVAVWLCRAKAILAKLAAGYQQLDRVSKDPASPLFGRVVVAEGFDLETHGIRPLESCTLPGLCDIPGPL